MTDRLRATLVAPKTVKEVVVFDTPYLVVKRVQKLMPSGHVAIFDLREEADVAVCLPLTSEGKFVLLEEYRHGPGRSLIEIPAGLVDQGESPEMAAAREAFEETGYRGSIEYLGSCWISAYSNARKHIFLMRGAVKEGDAALEPSEMSKVLLVSREELEGVLRAGELTDLDAGLLCLRAIG